MLKQKLGNELEYFFYDPKLEDEGDYNCVRKNLHKHK